MRKIIIIIICFIATVSSYGQFINPVGAGSATTLNFWRGGISADSANIILSKHSFADTIAANLSVISKYRGTVIYTSGDNSYWIRRLNPNVWDKLNTSSSNVSGSGVANQVTFWNGTNTITGSTGLTYATNTLTTPALATTSVSSAAANAISASISNNSGGFAPLIVSNTGSGDLTTFSNSVGVKLTIANSGLATYGNNLGSSYTNRSLVDKGYVDSIKGSLTLNQVLTNGNISTLSASVGVLSVTGSATLQDKVYVDGNVISKGLLWKTRVTPDSLPNMIGQPSNLWFYICYGNNRFVSVSEDSIVNNRAMTSADGINWVAALTGVNSAWRSVCYGAGLFVAVAYNGTNRIMTSPDGVNWTGIVAPAAKFWHSVTYGNGIFVAVAYDLTGGNNVMTSTDGLTWTLRTTPVDNSWHAVTYANGLFVAVGQAGTGNRVMTSPDGITWTARTSAADYIWTSICYGNGLFVSVAATAAGDNVMTSPDGITWTLRTSASSNLWRAVTYGNGLFTAVSYTGSGNRVMTSVDGINWSSRTGITDNSWVSVAYGNGVFAAVSYDGIIGSTPIQVISSGKQDEISVPLNNIYQGGITVKSLTNLDKVAIADYAVLGGMVQAAGNIITQAATPKMRVITTSSTTVPVGELSFETSNNNVKWQVGTNHAIGVGFEVNEGDGANNRLYIAPTSGIITAAGLTGTGTQMVVAASNGTLGRQAIPSFTQYIQPFSATSLTSVSPYTNLSVTGSIGAGSFTTGGTLTVAGQTILGAAQINSGLTMNGASSKLLFSGLNTYSSGSFLPLARNSSTGYTESISASDLNTFLGTPTQYLQTISATSLTTVSPYVNLSVTGTISSGVLSSLSILSNDIVATPSGSNAGVRVRDMSSLNSIYPHGFIASPLNSNRVSVSASNAPSTGTYVSVYTNLNSTNLDTSKINFIQSASGTPWTGALLPTTLTAGRQWLLPNASGTIALTSDIPSVSGYVPYVGATANVNLGSFSLTGSVVGGNTLYGVNTTGNGVKGDATTGQGVYGQATTGIAGYFSNTSSTNPSLDVHQLGNSPIAQFGNSGAVVTSIGNNGTLTTTGIIQAAGLTITNNGTIGGNLVVTGNIQGSALSVSSETISTLNPYLHIINTGSTTNASAAINYETSQGTVRWQTGTNHSTGTGYEINEGDGANRRMYIAPGGVITVDNLAGTGSRAVLADASGVLSAPVSDYRVKKNLRKFGYGINTIMNLTPKWGEYIDGWTNYGKGRQNFLIAQDVRKVIPEAVFITPSTGKLGINKDQLDAVYVQALQDLYNMNLEMNKQITELKAEIKALKKKK